MQIREHQPNSKPKGGHKRPGPRAGLARLLSVLALCGLTACQGSGTGGTDTTLRDLDQPIPLPGLSEPEQAVEPQQVPRMIVQRMDLPLDQPLDAAWTHIDEEAFPAITRGCWHANGLRIGVLHEQQVAVFAEQVPTVVNFFEKTVITRSHPVAIMQAAPLRPDTRIAVDLTLPPQTPHEVVIDGQQGGQLQLLARLEIEGDRTFAVITPHLYRPRPNDFTNRPLLERDLDGQVFNELSIRVELLPDRLIAIGLYWPWTDEPPAAPAEDADQPANPDQADDAREPETDAPGGEVVVDTRAREEITALDSVLTTHDAAPSDDPAAPPQRVRPSPQTPIPVPRPGPEQDAEQAPERAMPPLPMHFGRVLMTGTRARKPVQTMLLISIPPPVAPQAPAEQADQVDPGDE